MASVLRTRRGNVSVVRTEIGLVSADDALVAFYASVFGLAVLEPRSLPMGTIHRVGNDEPLVKIMVPHDAPQPGRDGPNPFWAEVGLQYVTFWVDDLDAVAAAWEKQSGATITLSPKELRPGVRTMVARDPDGNQVEIMEQSG